MASKLLGRGDSGAGDTQEITLGTNLSITGTTLNAAGGGGPTPTGTGFRHVTAGVEDAAAKLVDTADVNNDQITYAKIQNVSATDRLLGRDTAAAGDTEELTVGGGLEFTGTGGIQRSALTGDVTASAGSASTTIANDAVTTAKILNAAVTYAKIQDVSVTDRLLGRDTAAAGDVEELTVGGGLEFTGTGGVQRSALTGDVTASAGSGSTTIANDAVTNTKAADMAQSTIKGRAAGAGTGDPTDLTAAQTKTILAIALPADVSITDEVGFGAHSLEFTSTTNTPSAGAVTINWKNGNKQKLSLTGNVTSMTLTAPANPCSLTLMVQQDATGGRTVSWPTSVKWPGGGAPTITTAANAVDIVTMYFDGTNYYSAFVQNFS